MNSLDKAGRAVPDLREFLNRLIRLATDAIQSVHFAEENHLKFMSWCFLCKQIDHAKSVLRLVPHKDATLIARSMADGLCQLLWAAKEPGTRPLQWRSFAWIHDWRVMREMIRKGQAVAPERQEAIRNALAEYGGQFLTKKARESVRDGQPMPDDPYHQNWRAGVSIKRIFEQVGADDLYSVVYIHFSDWEHWGVGGVGDALSGRSNNVRYSAWSNDEAPALTVSFQCLWQTLEVYDRSLGGGRSVEIRELYDAYLQGVNLPEQGT